MTFWRLQLLGWSAFWLAMAGSRIGRFPLPYMLATKGAMAAVGFLMTGIVLRPLYRRLLPDSARMTRTVVLTAVVSYLAAIAWTAADSLVDIPIARALLTPTARISNFWQIFGGTLYNAFILLSWSVLYVGIRHQRALQVERERALRAEALAQSARLDALRSRVSPHFLFNALNAISTLVMDGRSRDAVTMIAQIGDLLRSTLRQPGDDDVSLEEEIATVRQYLAIEQVRLGDRLRVEFDVDAAMMQARVPYLILQPLAENAVRHAAAEREEGGCVLVRAEHANGSLWLSVEDDGPGLDGSAAVSNAGASRTGIGLANTRERIAQRFGAGQRVVLEPSVLGGLRGALELPYRT